MRNENYHHFEEYAAKCCKSHTLLEIVAAYVAMFPGRVAPIIAELVDIAREWDKTRETVEAIQDLNDKEA